MPIFFLATNTCVRFIMQSILNIQYFKVAFQLSGFHAPLLFLVSLYSEDNSYEGSAEKMQCDGR